MYLNFKLSFAFALLFLVHIGESQPAVFDVTKFGAKPDSNEDISKVNQPFYLYPFISNNTAGGYM